MNLKALDYFLWLASPCLQLWLLLALRQSGLDRTFPVFFKYTLLQVISVPLLATIQIFLSRYYYYSYWLMALVSIGFSFALIDALFKLAFHGLPALRHFGRIVFRWAVVVVLLTVAMGTSVSVHARNLDRLSLVLVATDRSSRIMLCALAILLLLSSAYLQISRGSPIFGITLGVAIVNLTKIVLDSAALQQQGMDRLLGRMNSVSYILVCVLWLVYVLQRTETPKPSPDVGDFDYSPLPEGDGSPETAFDALNEMVERLLPRS